MKSDVERRCLIFLLKGMIKTVKKGGRPLESNDNYWKIKVTRKKNKGEK